MKNYYTEQLEVEAKYFGFSVSQYKEIRSLTYRLKAQAVATLNKDVINLAFSLKEKQGYDIRVVKDSYILTKDPRVENTPWQLLFVKMYRSASPEIRHSAELFFATEEEAQLAISLKSRIERMTESCEFEKHNTRTIWYRHSQSDWEASSLQMTHEKSAPHTLARFEHPISKYLGSHPEYFGYAFYKSTTDRLVADIANAAEEFATKALTADIV